MKPPDVIQKTVFRWMNRQRNSTFPPEHVGTEVMKALDDAGFTVISHDELDREITLAHQAGADEASEL